MPVIELIGLKKQVQQNSADMIDPQRDRSAEKRREGMLSGDMP